MNPKDFDDKFLWDAIKYRNDAPCLELLFRRYYTKLIDFSVMIISDEDAAGEIAADVFVKIWEKRTELDMGNVRAYLFVMAKNMSLNYLKNKNQTLSFEIIDETCKEVISDYNDPFQLLCDIEDNRYFDNLIDQLPKRRKIIFKLNRIDGLKYKEIAEILGISIRSVEDQMMHAFKFFRRAMKERDASDKIEQ